MIPIVTTTYFRNEKYCDLLIDLMDSMWPGHPQIWFISDSGRRIKHKNKIIIESANWCLRLREGLKYLKETYPDIRYIYHILEDLYPLWPCSVDQLLGIQEAAVRNKLNCVSITTYDCDFDAKTAFDKTILYKIPKTFSHYSQIQVGIWKFEHILETCEYALNNGIEDCWKFELVVSDDHYVADYRWPTVMHGFLVEGWINRYAVKAIKMPAGDKLRHMLIKDSIAESPRYVSFRIRRKIRNLLFKPTRK